MKRVKRIESHMVPDSVEHIRLSDYLKGIFITRPSRKGIKKVIDKGLVRINGKVASTGDWIKGGETIELYEAESHSRPKISLKLEVLFEDDHLAIINKPAGIEVSGNKKWTIENALLSNLALNSEPDALNHPHPIHRLDYPTSGALLVGKTSSAVTKLNQMFENREVTKVYYAIVTGKLESSGTINSPIGGKPSISNYQVIQYLPSNKYSGLNLVQLKPQTGRRHQLRKHMASMGNPILGDRLYGTEGKIMSGAGLFLHASSLKFLHPATDEELFIESELPKKFLKLFPNA